MKNLKLCLALLVSVMIGLAAESENEAGGAHAGELLRLEGMMITAWIWWMTWRRPFACPSCGQEIDHNTEKPVS